MVALFDLLLTLLILPIELLVVFFAIEVLAALLSTPKCESSNSPSVRPNIAILVPAHNEEKNLFATLESVKSQLWTVDHLLVVADNCADGTAGIAADFGAEVIERHDSEQQGKGYALDFGIRHLERYRPDVVIVIDADCIVEPGSIDRLAIACADSGRPVQALNLMCAPEGAGLKLRIAEFAWLVKNRVRALGLRKLGLPCQLMGTGMAFPWATISKAKVASGNIVEDLELGLSLAQQGVPPMFCPEAKVSSIFPTSSDGVNSQRTRWEHGHLGMIIQQAPGLFVSALKSRNLGLMALVLDMSVPPLALLLLMVLGAGGASGVFWLFSGAAVSATVAGSAIVILFLSVLLAWRRFARDVISLRDLAYAPVYMLQKVPLYLKYLIKRETNWIRSRRD
ncbi:MAG: glycosyltransferase family 2 protein [Candidatus Sedimenticola sp. (ex Thyasira tokunagai)]